MDPVISQAVHGSGSVFDDLLDRGFCLRNTDSDPVSREKLKNVPVPPPVSPIILDPEKMSRFGFTK